MSKNIVFEPTIELAMKEHNPKHLRVRKGKEYRDIVVSCRNGHQLVVKAALYFSKSRKNLKRYHTCKVCGETLYLES